MIACAITAVVCLSTAANAVAKAKVSSSGCHGADAVPRDEGGRERAIRAVLCTVNLIRASHGARPLRASHPLRVAATSHSSEMIQHAYFSHVSPDGADVRSRVTRSGYIRRSRKTLVDETIAWGSGRFATPAELVASFMGSATHRAALLNRRYRDVGIGLLLGAPMSGVRGPATTLTLDFGRR
jgi:uncharacterized protein YkwD